MAALVLIFYTALLLALAQAAEARTCYTDGFGLVHCQDTTNTPRIIGGIIAGVVLLATVVALLVWTVIRRHRRQRQMASTAVYGPPAPYAQFGQVELPYAQPSFPQQTPAGGQGYYAQPATTMQQSYMRAGFQPSVVYEPPSYPARSASARNSPVLPAINTKV